MPQNFISCDRDQPLLMPPSLRDWLPADHVAWTILDARRRDGPAPPSMPPIAKTATAARPMTPSMMVALLLYAYAKGNRSSRGIERACSEDVAYRVIAANRAPDHSTIAEFRSRHEAASPSCSPRCSRCARRRESSRSA